MTIGHIVLAPSARTAVLDVTGAHLASYASALRRAFRQASLAAERRRELARLSEVSDHLLADVGVDPLSVRHRPESLPVA